MKNFYPSVRNLLSPGQVRLLLSGMAVAFVMAVLPGKVFAQAPVISYSTPQTYPVGTAITPLSPANSAGAVAAPAYITASVAFGPDFAAVSGITVDASGNIYFADGGLGSVYKKLAGGGATVIIASGFADIGAMAADAPGNVYFCAPVEGNVYKIDGGGGITTIGSGFSRPAGVAVDGAGNVYVADYNSGLVKEIPASGGSMINIGSGFVAPASVAVDGQDNVYVLDQGNVVEVPANGGSQVTVASGFPGALCLAVDFAGDAYLFDAHSTNLWMIPAGGSESIISSQYANFLAVDGAGNLYISDDYDNTLNELSPVGGYYINKGLPAGLSFNVSTGTISGTPTAVSAAANYTVTGYNAVGSGTATVTITVNPVPPAISYSTPQTYNAATAITPLSPANTGGAAAAFGYNTTATEIPTGVNDALSLAADKSGNMYIGEEGGNISLLPAGGGAATVFASGFAHVYSVAVDASNNVYAADNANVWKIPAGGGTAVSLGSFSSPVGLAFDPAGYLYVASNGGSNPGVYKMSTDGTGQTRIDNNLQGPAYIAFDTNGNLFIGDQNTGSLYEIPAGGSQTQLASGLSGVVSVKTDLSGNVYVSVFSGRIYCYSPASGLFQIDSNSAYGLMTDANFNLYYASGSGIYKISPNGGYFTNPELPQGLVINQSSGVISGMPAGISPATNYTVTAFNAGGSGSAAINILINPTLPTISYTSPQSYQVGSSISALSPSSSNVASWGYSTGITAVSSGFGAPVDVAADAAGNVYVADFTMNQVEKIPAGGGAPVVFSSGFSQPFGVAADAAGNVYVADAGNNAVKEILAGAGTINTIGSGFNGPSAVAVDGPGNVYVGDTGNGALKEIPAGNGTPVILQSGFASIQGVAVDAAGNVYVADAGTSGNGAVYKVPAGGGSMVSVGTGFSRPSAVTVDAAGNLYVSDVNNTVITVIEPGGTQFTVGSGFNHANGVTFDNGGNLYIADSGNGLVKEVKITGGYFLSPLLPAGLTFNNSTGVISGTPAAPAPMATYTVTGYNGASSSSAAISITVGAPIISYTSPVAYAAGAAITPLTPTSTGGAVPALSFSSSTTKVSTGITDATCMAMDKNGNLYIGEYSGQVSVLAPGSTAATVFATGFSTYIQDGGIAVDASGSVYVADNESLWKIPAGGGTSVKLSSFEDPSQVSTDAAGNLYIRDNLRGIYKMASDGTNKTQIYNGFVSTMAVDQDGNVFFSGRGSQAELFEIPAGGIQKTVNPSGGRFFTTDPSGNFYLVEGDGSVSMVPANGTNESQVAPAISNTRDIMVGPDFNLYIVVGDFIGDGSIIKASPTGGYFISPELPLGLNIDPATGAISGTPAAAAASSTANYTVKAFNGDAGATATVNITVAPAPAISYTNPQTYTAGLPIAPLQPASTGGVVSAPGFNALTETLNTGITDATCTAMDKNGNLYIGESSGKISVLAPGNTAATVFATGFVATTANGIAVDASGNVYFADEIFVWKIPAGGGTAVPISGISDPTRVSTDAAGNLYVQSIAGIYKMASDGSNITQLISGTFFGATADQNGNVFFSGRGSQAKTFEIPAGGVQKTVNSDASRIYTTDPSGNIYMVNGADGTIGMIPANGTIESQVEPSIAGISSIMIGPDFNLYAVVSGSIVKAAPTGGYFISPELPVGLNIDPTSGVISGTPSAASVAADYTVTAFSNSVGSSATVNITVNPLTPAISYSTPQVYTQNTAITPLSPASTNVATPGYLSTATTAGSFSQPYATAVDQSGNVYVADKAANSIYELPAGGGQVSVGTGLNTPAGVAVDKSGNIYTANQGDNTVVEIQARTGTQSFIGSGYQRPTAVAVDSAGNVFVADVEGAAGVVYKISPGQNKVLFKSGFISPNGIAVDAAGNVYVSDFGGGPAASMVYQISPDGSTETPINHSFSTATGLAIDAAGNLFIADAGNTDIVEYPAGGGSAITLTAGLTFPFGLSADGAGNLYVADPGADQVVKMAPAGGYFINRVLPAGLSFNTTTGTVSGTPATASPATNYTVTAYSSLGSGTAALNIKVNTSPSDATLSGLALSNGTLSPGFAPGTTGYNIAVGNGLSTMTVTPTADNPNATITVQGQTVASGTPSQYLTLATGITSVPVVVTSFDHSTTKTYTLNIKEAKSQNANLTSLKRSSGILIPGFTADGTTYTENVDNGTATMSVIPTAANANATITVNGTTVASGSPSPTYNLPAGGSKVITIMVTAQMGNTKTYTLTVNRALSGDASLSALTISGGTLAPKFEPLTQLDAYGAKVNSSITTIEVTPTATSAEIQSITVNTAAVSSGSSSGPITLSSPTTPVTIVVTAQDGTQRTYTVTITRVINDASLSNLQVDAGTFTPKFQPLTLLNTYSTNEANGTNSVNVTPTTTDPGATITINTNTAISGQPYAVATSTGTNPVTIVVTSSDGSTTRTYKLSINVAAPPADNTVYQPLGVEKPTDSPMLNNDGVLVHQAISPNGDGINDFLQIDNISQYPDNKLSIMNRNGQLIYEASGYDNSSKIFDGHSSKNGRMQLPGTYFYQLDYTVNGITKHKTGFLVLKY